MFLHGTDHAGQDEGESAVCPIAVMILGSTYIEKDSAAAAQDLSHGR